MASSQPSYWQLLLRAKIWRAIELVIFLITRYSDRHLKPHSFKRKVKVQKPFTPGSFNLLFYTPYSYSFRKSGRKYPVVVNFHAGGFCIGNPRFDIRWANQVNEQAGAVVVSVDYRLAPEHKYPVAVQDCVLALDYIARNAEELGLDIDNVYFSGFSAGGNLVFTTALLYHTLQNGRVASKLFPQGSPAIPKPWNSALLGPPLNIHGIISFYPGLDFTLTRAERKASNPNEHSSTSPSLSQLFDLAYYPAYCEDKTERSMALLSDPFISPVHADDSLLDVLPEKIVVITCEWDMLRMEAEQFGEKLQKIGKRVDHIYVRAAPHLWDKLPGWVVGGKFPESRAKIGEIYEKAMKMLPGNKKSD